MSELKSREDINVEQLYNRIANKIEVAKRNVMIQVNKEMTVLYWNIGKDIKEKLLGNEKAEYGKSVIKELSKRLVIEYGRGYSIRNIFNMLKFYEYYPNFEILQTLSAKLSWSHFVELLQISNDVKREFYTTMCANEIWSVRTLRERIGSALFEGQQYLKSLNKQ